MRSFIGSLMLLGVVGIAPSTASADVGTESRTRYASCICNCGYPDPVCRPVVSCMRPRMAGAHKDACRHGNRTRSTAAAADAISTLPRARRVYHSSSASRFIAGEPRFSILSQ